MVDMVITIIWFSGPKSRSVNNVFQQPDFVKSTLASGLRAAMMDQPPTHHSRIVARFCVWLWWKVGSRNLLFRVTEKTASNHHSQNTSKTPSPPTPISDPPTLHVVCRCFFDSEKMTFLDLLDMYLIVLVIFT